MRYRSLVASVSIIMLCIAGSANFANSQTKTPAAPPVASAVPVRPSAKTDYSAADLEFFEKKVRPVLAQNCYECHSRASGKSYGGLALDSRQSMLKGGLGSSALIAGDPEKSRIIEAVKYQKAGMQMPPKSKLSDSVIADLVEWVKRGAAWPDQRIPALASAKEPTAEKKKSSHWSFQPVRKPRIPAVKRANWAITDIDKFILSKLETKGLAPAVSADRRTLIRRASFDLLGLPPTPEEIDAFVADKSPNAWEKLVDRLLASPHYGERWGRYWLDVARYGEDQAHSFEPRLYPQGFRFRDWVANSLNNDMPYDRFIKEQIAADLMNETDMQQQLPALGFFAMGPVYYGDAKMFDQYDDRIDTLSRGFLGLTVACARCHDHKFDPISQKDYYALAGVFASTAYIEVPISGSDAAKTGKPEGIVNRNDMISAKTQEVDKFINEHLNNLRNRFTPEIAKYIASSWKFQNRKKSDSKLDMDKFAASEGLESLPLERWTKYLAENSEKKRPQLNAWSELLKKQDGHTDLSASPEAAAEAKKAAENIQNSLLALKSKRDRVAQQKKDALNPEKLEAAETAALNEVFGENGVLTFPRDQFEKLLVGDPKAHYAIIKAELQRMKMGSFIHALTEGPKIANIPVLVRGNSETPGSEVPRHFLTVLSNDNPAPFVKGSGRLELANAIADRNNPLTARVMVNRIWQHHFGVGLVKTTSNFGLLGEPPAHPELLDYLASQFTDQGWSLKTLHKRIMLSAVYKMSSASNPHNYEIDPDNRYRWRMNRQRLDIEAWRDAMLAVTDKLDHTVGGPSVSLSDGNNHRRTFYAAVSRHDLEPMLRLFDFPDPNATTDSRLATTVPLQQLFVLNSEFMAQQAKAFAARINAVPSEAESSKIRRAFLLAYGRPPTSEETLLGMTFLLAPKLETTAANSPSKLSRWEKYAQVLLSANEFLYID